MLEYSSQERLDPVPLSNLIPTINKMRQNLTVQISNNNKTYRLVQVCLFGHWSYICSMGFTSIADKNVTWNQLGLECAAGGGLQLCL